MMYKKKIKKIQIMPVTGVDDPLSNPIDDCLDRQNFAKRIFTLIDSTPLDTHLRVGILGDWGSGKTTAMNFIRHYCQAKGHPVAFFHPWQFHSREDAWKGFVASLDKGLGSWKKLPLGNFRRKKIIKDISGKARQIAEIADTKIGKAIGDLILSPLENLLEESKANVTKDLKDLLKEKRLYVFIDDLDRAEPEIVYDMLMLFNEIFDISQCVYIIGLDAKTVSQALKEKLGYVNPKDFLDKIINWPFELPSPSSYDWEALIDSELNSSAKDIVKDAIVSIAEILPRNPRKLKHYLRYLNSLHKAFLTRFGRDGLDWKVLYTAQLLRMEFPEIFKELILDDEIIEDIGTGRLTDEISGRISGADKKEVIPDWKKKVGAILNKYQSVDSIRFFKLYEYLRGCGGYINAGRMRNHLLVIEVPELLTWSEYRDIKAVLFDLDDSGIANHLKKLILNNRKTKEIESGREFIRMLLRDREEIWNKLIDMHVQNGMKPCLEEVDKIMRICNLLTDLDEIFNGHNPVFDKTVFNEWFGLLTKWAHFQNPPYESIRQAEKELLLKMVNKNLSRASEVSEWLRAQWRDFDVDGSQKALADLRKQIEDVLGKRLANDLLARFEKPDGIKELWPGDSFIAEKKILLKDGTFFHNEENYSKLRIIAEEAKSNIKVHENFVEALRLFFYYSTGHGEWVLAEDAKVLIKKSGFFGIIWFTAICRPLNRRFIGSMEEYIKPLELIVDDRKFFERPLWWKALITDKAKNVNKDEN